MAQTDSEKPPEDGAEPPPRLPLGSRISVYYILVFIVLFVIGPLAAMLYPDSEKLEAVRSGEAPMDIGFQLWLEALLAPVVVAMTLAYLRFVDKKPLHAIGAAWPPERAQRAARDLSAAFLGAAGILALWYVAAGILVRFETTPRAEAAGVGQLALLALGFLAAATLEEWILRGYFYSTLRERLSWVHSGGITALIFVIPSLASPEIGAPGLVNAFLIGFTLAAIRELTGSLWPCVVFHGSWNFLMGCILALPISGTPVPGLREVAVSGSQLWSGGDYGPEGSWLMVAMLLLAVVAAAAVLSRGEEADAAEDEG